MNELTEKEIDMLSGVEYAHDEGFKGLTVPDEVMAEIAKKLCSYGLLKNDGIVQVVDEDGTRYDEYAPSFSLTEAGEKLLEAHCL